MTGSGRLAKSICRTGTATLGRFSDLQDQVAGCLFAALSPEFEVTKIEVSRTGVRRTRYSGLRSQDAGRRTWYSAVALGAGLQVSALRAREKV